MWNCSDDEALELLVSLNRLAGTDDEAKRRALLEDLLEGGERPQLEQLLPAGDLDLLSVLDELSDRGEDDTELPLPAPAEPAGQARRLTFTVTAGEQDAIEFAISTVVIERGLTGSRRRGRALALVCGLEESPDV